MSIPAVNVIQTVNKTGAVDKYIFKSYIMTEFSLLIKFNNKFYHHPIFLQQSGVGLKYVQQLQINLLQIKIAF